MTEETFFQKEKRLKARKQVYKETYRKGLFLEFNDKDKLIEWIKQEDVIIRVNSGGNLNDDTKFVSVIVEGFKS